jgi:hypothetical protein
MTASSNGFPVPPLVYDTELYVGLSRLRRPIEYVFFPGGQHVIRRARQRAASFQATVDWMNFWLRDVQPADAQRASRWGAIRREWQRQQAWEAAGHPACSTPDESFVISSD